MTLLIEFYRGIDQFRESTKEVSDDREVVCRSLPLLQVRNLCDVVFV